MWLIWSELYCFEIEYKKLFFIAFIGRKQAIHGFIAETLKRLPEQNFHHSPFISKRSFICCGGFINFIVVAVLINRSNL